ncbi:MAG: phosphoribosylanthranilate isomerase, partial [Bacteroidales bacterium]|jgi:phosphoribosylanthranilate isomerase|nr:phosphoribosylanthranilate isomerase [Bacteroidales bacterium]
MGFIFYPRSPRCVDDACVDAIRSCSKLKTGVFVNEQPEEILRKVEKYRLNYVQLHGDESPDDCRRLQDAGCAVIKAFSVSSAADLEHTQDYAPFVDYLLFDTKGSERGGTGKRFHWPLLNAFRGGIPFLLSGGIGPEHLADLHDFRHPLMAGIDLNSRFESAPAMKDAAGVEEFVRKLRMQEQQVSSGNRTSIPCP